MRKKKLLGILTAAALCLGMTGCGENQMPELTDAQVKEIGQYVAFILMKYNSNGGADGTDPEAFRTGGICGDGIRGTFRHGTGG